MEVKDNVLNRLDTEFYREVVAIKESMIDDPDNIEYLNNIELGLLELANRTIKQNYNKFKELPEAILLYKYKSMEAKLNSLATFTQDFVCMLAADIEDLLSDCYTKGNNLSINLNKSILDNMQKAYALLLEKEKE